MAAWLLQSGARQQPPCATTFTVAVAAEERTGRPWEVLLTTAAASSPRLPARRCTRAAAPQQPRAPASGQLVRQDVFTGKVSGTPGLRGSGLRIMLECLPSRADEYNKAEAVACRAGVDHVIEAGDERALAAAQEQLLRAASAPVAGARYADLPAGRGIDCSVPANMSLQTASAGHACPCAQDAGQPTGKACLSLAALAAPRGPALFV